MTVRLRVLVFGVAHHQRILDGWRNIPTATLGALHIDFRANAPNLPARVR